MPAEGEPIGGAIGRKLGRRGARKAKIDDDELPLRQRVREFVEGR